MKARVVLLALLMSAPVAFTACGSKAQQVDVVVTAYPLEHLANAVSGGSLKVSNVTPLGAEPHDLELSARDLDEMAAAKAVFYIGGGFAQGAEDAARQQNKNSIDVLTNRIAPDANNPHFWLDPVLYGYALDLVAQKLIETFPDRREQFESNAARYKDELERLNQQYLSELRNCKSRVVATAHDAFGYLASRYDLRTISIAGISPEAEPNPARLASIRKSLSEEGVSVIFTESLASPDVADTLARELGVKTRTLNPLEGLTQDDRDANRQYEDIMRMNLTELRNALGCTK